MYLHKLIEGLGIHNQQWSAMLQPWNQSCYFHLLQKEKLDELNKISPTMIAIVMICKG